MSKQRVDVRRATTESDERFKRRPTAADSQNFVGKPLPGGGI
jgi:hypothetical protein